MELTVHLEGNYLDKISECSGFDFEIAPSGFAFRAGCGRRSGRRGSRYSLHLWYVNALWTAMDQGLNWSGSSVGSFF